MSERPPEFRPPQEAEKEQKAIWAGETPEKFRDFSRRVVDRFISTKKIEGKEHLRDLPKDRRVIVVSSHLSNLDAPLIVDALGGDMNLQIAVMSTHFKDIRKYMLGLAGEESFSPITYEKVGGKKRGQFDPSDFEEIKRIAEQENKVPWIAAHRLQADQRMGQARIGPAYLAEIMDAVVLPVAVDIEGAGASLKGIFEIGTAFVKKLTATVHIGAPIDIPHFPYFDMAQFAKIALKVPREKPLTAQEHADENREFSQTAARLRDIADEIGHSIAAMLPEAKRGEYGTQKE